MKRKIFRTLFIIALFFSFSCEDYLEKSPESILDQEEVFKDFDHAQGFVEEIYGMVPDLMAGAHSQTDWVLGDDGFINNGWQPSAQIDKGNLNGLQNRSDFSFFVTGRNRSGKPNDNAPLQRPGIWDGGWKGIRKANWVIENIDLMVNATEAEKDVILGQAYFFRAFLHYEIMKYWGRMPYIDKVLTDDYKIPRPKTYKEPALRIDEDFKKAAELLPVDWDNEPYGQKTFGKNKLRVTKGAAYSYMGQNLLFAASPLMKVSNETVPATAPSTYDYDTELAAKAVDALAEVLKLGDQGVYALSTFENYEEVFWKVPYPQLPGGKEFIFTNTTHKAGWLIKSIPQLQMHMNISGGSNKLISPTHTFIHHNFGMANGLSIEDDMSGNFGTPTYNPLKPFENRDPRFYKWIIIDGDTLVEQSKAGVHQTAKLYKGGRHRTGNGASQTGYMFKKFYPKGYSKWNNIDRKFTPIGLRMRYTEIYLMYAEALLVAKGNATTAPASYSMTAEQAINTLRDRTGIPHVHSSIVGNKEKFMDELRRERAVELSWEVQRWVDIRRWAVAHLPEHTNKSAVEFPEMNENGEYAYFEEVPAITRVCEWPKHYWIPIPSDQTFIYEGFPQNAGW